MYVYCCSYYLKCNFYHTERFDTGPLAASLPPPPPPTSGSGGSPSLPSSSSYEAAIEIDQHTESNHDTALTLAAAGGHDELVELLLARGANIEHRDKKGEREEGGKRGKEGGRERGREGEREGGREREERREGETYTYTCSTYHRYIFIILFLGCTPLILAANAGHAMTVAILLEHEADIEAQTDRTKDTALSLACSSGRQEVSYEMNE